MSERKLLSLLTKVLDRSGLEWCQACDRITDQDHQCQGRLAARLQEALTLADLLLCPQCDSIGQEGQEFWKCRECEMEACFTCCAPAICLVCENNVCDSCCFQCSCQSNVCNGCDQECKKCLGPWCGQCDHCDN